MYYRLVNREVKPCNQHEWMLYFVSKDCDRYLCRSQISECISGKGNKVEVSTVFLGLDHRHGRFGEGLPPVVFETMIFGGALDQKTWRYCTYDEAMIGHAHACTLAAATV